MAKQGPSDKKKVNSAQDYELSHVATKMGVSIQQVVGAKRATGSNDRAVVEKYISDKGSKGSSKSTGAAKAKTTSTTKAKSTIKKK